MTYPPEDWYPESSPLMRRLVWLLVGILGALLLVSFCYTPAPALFDDTPIVAERLLPALVTPQQYEFMKYHALKHGIRDVMNTGDIVYYKRYIIGTKSPPGDEQLYLMRAQFNYLPAGPGSGVNITLSYIREYGPGVRKTILFFMDDADMDRHPDSIVKAWNLTVEGILKRGGVESISVIDPMWNYWLNYFHKRFLNEVS